MKVGYLINGKTYQEREIAPIQPPRLGMGDVVERVAKPIAKALKLPCLDGNGRLKPESGCARRKAALNKGGLKGAFMAFKRLLWRVF
jgi:hypothetical protein